MSRRRLAISYHTKAADHQALHDALRMAGVRPGRTFSAIPGTTMVDTHIVAIEGKRVRVIITTENGRKVKGSMPGQAALSVAVDRIIGLAVGRFFNDLWQWQGE
jgi:hypothetical protein